MEAEIYLRNSEGHGMKAPECDASATQDESASSSNIIQRLILNILLKL